MKPENELITIILSALFTGLVSVIVSQAAIFIPDVQLQTVILMKVFFTSFSAVLLSGLAFNYLRIHREMSTPMSRSLLVFSLALLFYAVTSSPLVHVLAGFEVISVGAFTFLPDIFVAFATLAILRESYR